MNNLNPPIVPLSELFDPPKEATPAVELERQIMSSMVPKSEREHWAAKEIDRLRAEVERLWALCAEAAEAIASTDHGACMRGRLAAAGRGEGL